LSTNIADKALQGLAIIGQDEQSRKQIIATLRMIEGRHASQGFNVRNEVTGPIVDALHRDTDVLCVRLLQGVDYYFRYQGNIHRELVMSPEENPDHVWEPQTTRLLLHLACGATNVVIGGAYSGDHALLIAHSLQGKGTVFCFEPNSAERGQLEYNAIE